MKHLELLMKLHIIKYNNYKVKFRQVASINCVSIAGILIAFVSAVYPLCGLYHCRKPLGTPTIPVFIIIIIIKYKEKGIMPVSPAH